MVTKYIQSNLLFCISNNSFLKPKQIELTSEDHKTRTTIKCTRTQCTFTYLHVCIMYTHTAENGKRFYKVLIIFGKYEIIKLVD